MKRLSIILASALLFIPAPGMAQDDHQKWYACRSNDECILSHDVCDGQASINKEYLPEHESFIARVKPIVECHSEPLPDNPDVTAQCIKNKCALVRP